MGIFKHNNRSEIIHVDGMKCEHCAQKVVDALKKNKVRAAVSIADKTVEISYDESKISLDEIKKVIHDLGYTCM